MNKPVTFKMLLESKKNSNIMKKANNFIAIFNLNELKKFLKLVEGNFKKKKFDSVFSSKLLKNIFLRPSHKNYIFKISNGYEKIF